MKYKVLLPQDIVSEGKNYLIEHGYEIKMGLGVDVDTIKKDVVDCDAIIARTAIFPVEVLEAGPKLKVISRYGVGVDNIDIKAAERLGIWVTNTPNANSNTVAEAVLGFIISLGRNFSKCQQEVRKGNFEIRNELQGMDLDGKILGIIGLGKIGRLVAMKARLGLNMKILAYSPSVPKGQVPEGVEMVERWEDIFTRPDFVSLHKAYTGKKLVGMKEFSLMKPTAYFINVARGSIVFEEDLIKALSKNIIAGAALDVFEKEPLDNNNPLLTMDNVLLTPHNAALTKECSIRMAMQSAIGVDEVLTGRTPTWPVNKPDLPRK